VLGLAMLTSGSSQSVRRCRLWSVDLATNLRTQNDGPLPNQCSSQKKVATLSDGDLGEHLTGRSALERHFYAGLAGVDLALAIFKGEAILQRYAVRGAQFAIEADLEVQAA
jgi:hypothetical protein